MAANFTDSPRIELLWPTAKTSISTISARLNELMSLVNVLLEYIKIKNWRKNIINLMNENAFDLFNRNCYVENCEFLNQFYPFFLPNPPNWEREIQLAEVKTHCSGGCISCFWHDSNVKEEGGGGTGASEGNMFTTASFVLRSRGKWNIARIYIRSIGAFALSPNNISEDEIF